MDKKSLLPFKIGELAESRSFQSGFRGAWFRCKINDISLRKRQIEYALEYFDFPDEKITWTRIYQLHPRYRKKLNEGKRELMVRPQYPPVYHEHQMPPANTTSEVIVVVDGFWKVGDLVDWWKDGCYWSGRLTQILGNDKVQIELFPPPIGEGSLGKACCKDLRPSLDWSAECGWSVPAVREGENSRYCARLIKPRHQDLNFRIHAVDEGMKDVQATTGSSVGASASSQISANSLCNTDRSVDKSKHSMGKNTSQQTSCTVYPKGETDRPELVLNNTMGGTSAMGKTSFSDTASSSHVRDDSIQTSGRPANEDEYFFSGPFKKMRTGRNISLNSMYSDTLESGVLDLEELINRVKWLRRILESEVHPPSAEKPLWKFMEHSAPYTPK